MKTIAKIAVGALATCGVALAIPAEAGVSVGIGIGIPGCGPYACGYPGYGPPPPYWRGWHRRWAHPYWSYPYRPYPYPYPAYPSWGYPPPPPPSPPPPQAVERTGCTTEIHGVNFDFDKSTIRGDSDAILQDVLAIFRNDPNYAAEIGGHTDNVGSASYNMALSRKRADAVKNWLVAHGVASSRMTVAGYGFTRPLVPNTSPENRARNRRVELNQVGCTN